MRIEFQLTREDWESALWVHRRRHRRQTQTGRSGQTLMWPGCSAAALGLFLWVSRVDGGGWVAPAALVAFGLFVPLRLIAIRDALQDEEWDGARRLIQPTAWEFDDTGAHAETNLWNVSIRWPSFESYVEGPTEFLLYQSTNNFRTFPKRAFSGDEQIATFRALLLEHIIGPAQGFPITPTTNQRT